MTTMGRVFSYSEIERGMVPRPEDFDTGKKEYERLVMRHIERGEIDGAFIFGSTAAGTTNPRSDFDTLISLNGPSLNNYRALQSIANEFRIATGNRIPFGATAHTKESLQAGKHEINRFFGLHLLGPNRIIIGETDPADYMKFPAGSAKDILASYLFQKRRKLTVASYSDNPLDVRDGGGIQRMLELPNAIGRIVLNTLTEIGLHESPPDGAEKVSISVQSEVIFTRYGVEEGYARLRIANDMYNRLLKEALNNNLTSSEYEGEIRTLFYTIPHALQWIEQVQEAILPLFDQDQS